MKKISYKLACAAALLLTCSAASGQQEDPRQKQTGYLSRTLSVSKDIAVKVDSVITGYKDGVNRVVADDGFYYYLISTG